MRRARLTLLAIGALCVARTAHAQWELTVDAGAAALHQAGLSRSGSLLFGGTLDGATQNSYFRSSLLAAGSNSSADWSGTGQALVLGGFIDPHPRLLRWELSGAASAFSQSAARPTTTAEFAAGFQVGNALRGGSLGGGGGFSAHARDVIPVRRVSAMGWWGAGSERFDAGLDLTHTRQQFFLAPSIGATYVDATTAWRHEHRGISVDATLGYRAVSTGHVAKGAWLSGDAQFWLAPRAALVVSGGRTPADVVRGFPLATYVSMALRFSSRPHIAMHRTDGRGPRLSVARASADAVVIEVRAAGAKSVEVAGDFTGWAPVPLEHSGDVWRLERAIAAGLHRVALRVDGGEWTAPPNLPRVRDELTGAAAVMMVP